MKTTQAIVLQSWSAGATDDGHMVVGLLLEVRPDGKPAYQVKTTAVVARNTNSSLETGQVVQVKIDPKDPTRVILNTDK